MTLEEFDRRIAQINELLASAGLKFDEAAELHSALDAKLDRLAAKLLRREGQ
ncbi:MAG: hypothetical protein WAO35_16750 [Terriglobia bacterium]